MGHTLSLVLSSIEEQASSLAQSVQDPGAVSEGCASLYPAPLLRLLLLLH